MIDIIKLKNEIKLLSGQLIEHKKIIRDPIMNLPSNRGVYFNALRAATFKSRRVTKLCTLMALLRGKVHLSPFTCLESLERFRYSPASRVVVSLELKSLLEEDLLVWVEPEMDEFKKKELVS
jgi:hypothetical protein